MRSLLKSTILAFLALSASNIIAKNDSEKHNLESIFRNPQEVVETSCYWYWISGNISKEGIVNDLKAMEEKQIEAFVKYNLFHKEQKRSGRKTKLLHTIYTTIMDCLPISCRMLRATYHWDLPSHKVFQPGLDLHPAPDTKHKPILLLY